MNAPVVIWQRAGHRIVAVDAEEREDAETGEVLPGQFLAIERLEKDLMGGDCWLPIFADNDEAQHALNILKIEAACRNEVLPTWVRELLRDEIKALDELEREFKNEGGGAA